MIKVIDPRPYILIGCLIWVVSFYGETFNFQPYSTIGMILSPIITVFGVIHWFGFYKRTRGYYPKVFKVLGEINGKMRKNPFAGIGFMLSHILEVWTLTIIFWMLIVIFGFLTFGQSNAFKTSKEYCANHQEVLQKTGKIKYYGWLVSGSISTKGKSGNSNLSFTIVGEKGNFSVDSELTKFNNRWEVMNLKVK